MRSLIAALFLLGSLVQAAPTPTPVPLTNQNSPLEDVDWVVIHPGTDATGLSDRIAASVQKNLQDLVKVQVIITKESPYSNSSKNGLFIAIQTHENPTTKAPSLRIFIPSAKGSEAKSPDGMEEIDLVMRDLEQNRFKTRSTLFADLLGSKIHKTAKNVKFKNITRSNDTILMNANMPAVLLVFEEPKSLSKSSDLAEKIGQAIANGIVDYKSIVVQNSENSKEGKTEGEIDLGP